MKSFFAGLGIGAALGILFAPRSGDEIQDDVRGEVWLVRQCVAQLVDGYPAWAGVFLSLAQTCNPSFFAGRSSEFYGSRKRANKHAILKCPLRFGSFNLPTVGCD
jgi:gas vesicle protein